MRRERKDRDENEKIGVPLFLSNNIVHGCKKTRGKTTLACLPRSRLCLGCAFIVQNVQERKRFHEG